MCISKKALLNEEYSVKNFVCCVGLNLFLISAAAAIAAESGTDLKTPTNVPVELKFTAGREYADPFNEVKLDVVFIEPDGTLRRVPAFWAGGKTWKARYASPTTGSHRWQSECAMADDPGLHGLAGKIEIEPYRGDNPLLVHGPIRVAADKRHFEHADGTPFFWLGDTWWMGLCHRLHWPEDFQKLAADRKQKGFNVVQIVAGLYPDMHPFDPRGANEAGFPWEKDYARIRPEYFDAADARLQHLIDQGMTPCLVGAWGYFLPWMGVEKMDAHWRYLIARYGSWPIVWCAGGEANLPWYLAKGFPYDDREQVHGWTDVLRYIRQTDPWRRPLTIHPTAIRLYTSRNATDDVSLLDFDLLQTPHGQAEAVPITVRAMREAYAAEPTMPAVDGEAAYEKLGDSLPTEWTRSMFWLCMTNGACGHTYGANGIWQVNRKGQPHGASPTGGTYGVIAWDDAMNLPGSSQMAAGKRFFESLPWTKLVPMHESEEWAGSTTLLADWIWFPEGDPKRDAPLETRFFRRTFDIADPQQVVRARLGITADDQFAVWLNGKEFGKGAEWGKPQTFDAVKLLRNGRNVLAVAATNLAAPVQLNPAGLNARLEIELADGSSQQVDSDDKWRTAKTEPAGWREPDFDDSSWSAAVVTAKLGEQPWGPFGGSKVAPQSCGIGETLRVIYALGPGEIVVKRLRPNTKYRLTMFDPASGDRKPAGEIAADSEGKCRARAATEGHDSVILLELP